MHVRMMFVYSALFPRPTSVTTAEWSGPSVRVCVPGDSLDTAVMKFSIPQEVRHRYSKPNGVGV